MFYKLNGVIKRAKGGGGGGTVENIPEEFKPYIEQVMTTAQGKYDEGALAQTAGRTASQDAAFGRGAEMISEAAVSGTDTLQKQQGRLADRAATGGRDELMQSAAYEAAKQKAGLDRQSGAGGTLGSARGAIASNAMEGEMLSRANQQVFSNQMNAEGALGQSAGAQQKMAESASATLAGLGGQERAINQEGLDQDWTALQRYASTIYGNPSRQQATSGGK